MRYYFLHLLFCFHVCLLYIPQLVPFIWYRPVEDFCQFWLYVALDLEVFFYHFNVSLTSPVMLRFIGNKSHILLYIMNPSPVDPSLLQFISLFCAISSAV